MSCVLQPQNQTKVNTNLSLPAEVAAGRGARSGVQAADPAQDIPPPGAPDPRRARGLRAALKAGRRASPLLHSSSGLTERGEAGAPRAAVGNASSDVLGGSQGSRVPCSPAAPDSTAAAAPAAGAARRAETRVPVYCCRMAPSSVFLQPVTARATSLLFPKPQPRCYIARALVCAPSACRRNLRDLRLREC